MIGNIILTVGLVLVFLLLSQMFTSPPESPKPTKGKIVKMIHEEEAPWCYMPEEWFIIIENEKGEENKIKITEEEWNILNLGDEFNPNLSTNGED